MTPNEIRIEFFKTFELLDIGPGTNKPDSRKIMMTSKELYDDGQPVYLSIMEINSTTK